MCDIANGTSHDQISNSLELTSSYIIYGGRINVSEVLPCRFNLVAPIFSKFYWPAGPHCCNHKQASSFHSSIKYPSNFSPETASVANLKSWVHMHGILKKQAKSKYSGTSVIQPPWVACLWRKPKLANRTQFYATTLIEQSFQ